MLPIEFEEAKTHVFKTIEVIDIFYCVLDVMDTVGQVENGWHVLMYVLPSAPCISCVVGAHSGDFTFADSLYNLG